MQVKVFDTRAPEAVEGPEPLTDSFEAWGVRVYKLKFM